MRKLQMGGAIIVPLIARGKTLGVITLISRADTLYTDDDLLFAKAVSHQLQAAGFRSRIALDSIAALAEIALPQGPRPPELCLRRRVRDRFPGADPLIGRAIASVVMASPKRGGGVIRQENVGGPERRSLYYLGCRKNHV